MYVVDDKFLSGTYLHGVMQCILMDDQFAFIPARFANAYFDAPGNHSGRSGEHLLLTLIS